MQSKTPQENFPAIGTFEDPALFFDGSDVLLSYDVAPAAGGGIAILKFSHVIYFEKNPINVEGLGNAKYPAKAWDFTEVFETERTSKWKVLSPRFWVISFNDVTVEIVFSDVNILQRIQQTLGPSEALTGFLAAR